MKVYLLVFLWFLVNFNLFGQPILPEKGVVFNDQIVPKIYISIHPDSFQLLFLQENLLSNHEYPADFTWEDGERIETIQNIGFRLRGNTSRSSAKKSFKIKFDHFGSEKFYGLSEMNINGEHNDPSVIRSKLCWDLMRLAGIEAPRSNHVALYVNGMYMGLYIHVESMDNDYLRNRKKSTEGQLFKCNYGVDLVYRGSHPGQYSPQVYEPANHKSNPDYASFISFLQVLNNTNDPDYRCKLEEKFDVDDYLKRLAIEILTGHWDNPVFNKNNAYLYYNPESGKYQLLSYDMDNTFGIDWFNINWAEREIFDWSKPNEPRPIYEIIHLIPEYKERLGYYILKYTDDFFNPAFVQQHINPIRNRIASFRAEDPFAPLDYGYTFSDFLKSYNSPLGNHVKTGLYEFLNLRTNSAKNQVGVPNPAPIIEYARVMNTQDSAEIVFSVDAYQGNDVDIHYKINNGNWTTVPLHDDGAGYDLISGDKQYHWKLALSGKSNLVYYITGSGSNNLTSRLPVCGYFEKEVGHNPTPRLIINEFMADNNKIKDNAGEAEDWIEIFNPGDESIWLGNKFLTDKIDRPDKWPMPDITLNPGEFIVFWADEDQDQGENHTNFKLSKDGEFLGIFDGVTNNFAPIDTFYFSATETNISYGRYPDGEGPVLQLLSPTPGYSNLLTSTEDIVTQRPLIYPNPTDGNFTIQNLQTHDEIMISTSSGYILDSWLHLENSVLSLDLSGFNSGLYLVNIKREDEVFTLKLVKI